MKTLLANFLDSKVFIASQNVSQIIQETTEQIVGTLLVCEVYAQRYLGEHVQNQFRGTPLSVRNLIPELLALFLKFSHLASKHLRKKAFSKLNHGYATKTTDLADLA